MGSGLRRSLSDGELPNPVHATELLVVENSHYTLLRTLHGGDLRCTMPGQYNQVAGRLCLCSALRPTPNVLRENHHRENSCVYVVYLDGESLWITEVHNCQGGAGRVPSPEENLPNRVNCKSTSAFGWGEAAQAEVQLTLIVAWAVKSLRAWSTLQQQILDRLSVYKTTVTDFMMDF